MAQFDVGIIGGGPAGLTAASTLARQLHTAVVFDSGGYRNESSHHIHTVPGFEHKDPKEFREITRQQILSNYDTIQFANVEITSIEKKSDSHFIMVDSSGKSWEVKKLILGIGSSDILPQIEGYSVLWKKKIYHCLFCLGYEDRGAESAGVLAVQAAAMMPALAVHTAGNAAQLAKEVTIFTNGSSDVQAQLTPMVSQTPFKVDNREIARLVDASGGLCVEFKDESSRTVSFLAHHPLTYPQGPFAKQLELKQSATGDIQADDPLF
ncbi:nucleotide-binding domain-containing protein [Corynespora cassiicola Philippines]|uniref:Nucleotide-binding domain-containing protein n=1 Tax=Corynespora cassiicola Philippines TaxID=1448308 RepID=A0A2T2NF62_CORCC|nr:nucleotide-binding domain-containing protein [Corynespora cassiicola Philippines]